MTKRTASLFLALVFSLLFSSCKENNKTNILPGKGILINTQVVTLNTTSPKELGTMLGITDSLPANFVEAECFDEKGESFNCGYYAKTLHYKNIAFEFQGQEADNIQLSWIRVTVDNDMNLAINDSIKVASEFEKISQYFPTRTKYDNLAEDDLSYNLYSYGISFQYERVGDKRVLKEVSVHGKIED